MTFARHVVELQFGSGTCSFVLMFFALPSVPLMGKFSRRGPVQWPHAFLPLVKGFGFQAPPGQVTYVKSKKKTTKKTKCVHVQQSVEGPVISAHDARAPAAL